MRTALVALAVVVTACASGIDAGSDVDPTSDVTSTTVAAAAPDGEQPTPEPAEVEDVQDTPRSPAPKADLARETEIAASDLAGRLGMGDADIVVFSAESVVWRDGSLGCPEEGRAYTQALVQDGYRIILTANGETHHYHGAGSGDPFYCENPQEPYTGGAGTGSISPEA